MKNIALLALSFLLALGLQAQTIDLQQKHNLPVFASQRLSATYTVAQAKAKYPDYWTWIKWAGASDAQAMTVNEVAAAWNNEVWATDGYVAGNKNSAYPQNGCQSRAVIDASGIFYAQINVPLTLAHGQYFGGGTGNATETGSNHGGPGTTGGTQIIIDHINWLTTVFPDRNAMQSASWGDETNYGYSESFVVRGFRLEGARDGHQYDPSFRSSGVAIWDSGETSRLEYIFASGFNDAGIHNVRGTPTIIDGCSTFSNRRYGIWLDGGSLNTITIYSPSGDDNGPGNGTPGALIGGTAGYGREAGGTITIIGNKAETNNVQGRKHGDQRFLDLRAGAWNVTITGAWVFAATPQQECIAIDFGNHNGGLDVRGLKYTGFSGALALTAKGKTTRYSGPGNYIPASFVANETGIVWASRDMGQGGSAPAPTPCNWTCGAWSEWSACVNGKQTRTRSCTSTGDCASTASPATTETQTCGTTTPEPPAPEPPAGNVPDRSKWKATASASWSNGQPAKAIDNDPNSAWTNGRAQQVGEWLQVDLGADTKVSSVTFTLGASPWDFIAGWKIQGSTDGKSWADMTTGTGKYGTPMTATGSWSIRYVRLYVIKANGSMWVTVGNVEIK